MLTDQPMMMQFYSNSNFVSIALSAHIGLDSGLIFAMNQKVTSDKNSRFSFSVLFQQTCALPFIINRSKS